MSHTTDTLDLGQLNLEPGEGQALEVRVAVDDVQLAGQRYSLADGGEAEARVDLSRMLSGWALRLRFDARLEGPCMRCLEPARRDVAVDVREIDLTDGDEETTSPYFDGEDVDVRAWARDALVLALPTQIVCSESCRGLCAVCGVNLNDEGDHAHERAPDRRWDKLSEIRFD